MEGNESKIQDVLEKETTRRGFLKGVGAAAGVAVAASTVGKINPAVAAGEAAPKPVRKYLFAERQNCVGCRACEYACSMYHEKEVRPAKARIHVLKYKGIVDVPIICWHCDDAPCIKACPTKPRAIRKNPKTNGIRLRKDICLGSECHKCVEACPAEFIRVDPDDGQVLMCDLCDGDPECVKACLAQSGNPVGPCLMTGKGGFGVNQAYRNVTPEEAGEDLLRRLFYPNETGERRK